MRYMSVSELRPGAILAEDLYLPDKRLLPYVTKHSVLSAQHIAMLKSHGVGLVLVTDHIPKPNPQAVSPRSLRPRPTVTSQLKVQALDTLQNFFSLAEASRQDMATLSRLVTSLDTVVDQLVDAVARDRKTLVNIEGLRSYDEYTYHHSLSVAVLSVATGQALGLPVRELRDLARCALMHDIGKIAIPIEIINKPSRLDPDEFEIVKGHSTAGLNFLADRNISNVDLWQGVLFHHERVDGTGYPNKLRQDDIPLWSRIIAVADVYDALTSNRPYRKPMRPADAVEYIMAGVDTAFDYTVVKAFLSRLEVYPVGQRIRLSDGQLAVVLSNENTLRPVVQVLDTGELLDLLADPGCLSLTIVDVVETA